MKHNAANVMLICQVACKAGAHVPAVCLSVSQACDSILKLGL